MAEVKKRKPWLAIRLAVLLLILFALIGFWLYRTPPSYYKPPVDVPREVLDNWGSQCWAQYAKLDSAINDKSASTPIDVTFTEEAVNGWLRTPFGEDIRKSLPEGLSEPHIAFIPGRIAFAARWGEGWTGTVLSTEVAVSLPEPSKLKVDIAAIRAGSLPVPKVFFRKVILSHISEMLERGEIKGDSEFLMKQAESLLSGEPIPLVKKRFRIDLERVEIGDGRLRIVGRRVNLEWL